MTYAIVISHPLGGDPRQIQLSMGTFMGTFMGVLNNHFTWQVGEMRAEV